MKLLIKIILVIIVLLLLCCGVSFFLVSRSDFGATLPNIADLAALNTPRDLGVTYTEADFESASTKLTSELVVQNPELSPNEQLVLSEANPVDIELTNEELSAHLSQIHPVTDLQIKITGDEIEVAGKISREKIPGFARMLGITGASDQEIFDWVDQNLPVDPAFYFKGSGEILNENATVNMQHAELGRVPVSTEYAGQIAKQYMELVINQAPAFSVESMTLEDSKLKFKGTATAEIPSY